MRSDPLASAASGSSSYTTTTATSSSSSSASFASPTLAATALPHHHHQQQQRWQPRPPSQPAEPASEATATPPSPGAEGKQQQQQRPLLAFFSRLPAPSRTAAPSPASSSISPPSVTPAEPTAASASSPSLLPPATSASATAATLSSATPASALAPQAARRDANMAATSTATTTSTSSSSINVTTSPSAALPRYAQHGLDSSSSISSGTSNSTGMPSTSRPGRAHGSYPTSSSSGVVSSPTPSSYHGRLHLTSPSKDSVLSLGQRADADASRRPSFDASAAPGKPASRSPKVEVYVEIPLAPAARLPPRPRLSSAEASRPVPPNGKAVKHSTPQPSGSATRLDEPTNGKVSLKLHRHALPATRTSAPAAVVPSSHKAASKGQNTSSLAKPQARGASLSTAPPHLANGGKRANSTSRTSIDALGGRVTESDDAPIDPSNPLGDTKWNGHKRFARNDETVCTWRLSEQTIFVQAKRCNRRFVTADRLAQHILAEHVKADTPPPIPSSALPSSPWSSQLAASQHSSGSKLEVGPQDLLPRRDANARICCRWGTCSNRRYKIDELGRHVLHHLETQCGLKHSCPFIKCPTTTLLCSETALQAHLEIYHRDPYWESDLRPIYELRRVDRAALKPPPPLPGPGTPLDRRLCNPTTIMLGKEITLAPYERVSHARIAVPAPPSDEELPIIQESIRNLCRPVSPDEKEYCYPWTKVLPKLERAAETRLRRQAADAAIRMGLKPKRWQMEGADFEVTDVERPETRSTLEAIARGRFALPQQVERAQRQLLGVFVPAPSGLRESLGKATLRALATEEDIEEGRECGWYVKPASALPKPLMGPAGVVPGVPATQPKAAARPAAIVVEEVQDYGRDFDIALPGLGQRLIRAGSLKDSTTAAVEIALPPPPVSVKRENKLFVDLDEMKPSSSAQSGVLPLPHCPALDGSLAPMLNRSSRSSSVRTRSTATPPAPHARQGRAPPAGQKPSAPPSTSTLPSLLPASNAKPDRSVKLESDQHTLDEAGSGHRRPTFDLTSRDIDVVRPATLSRGGKNSVGLPPPSSSSLSATSSTAALSSLLCSSSSSSSSLGSRMRQDDNADDHLAVAAAGESSNKRLRVEPPLLF